jgi:hypothetical protein
MGGRIDERRSEHDSISAGGRISHAGDYKLDGCGEVQRSPARSDPPGVHRTTGGGWQLYGDPEPEETWRREFDSDEELDAYVSGLQPVSAEVRARRPLIESTGSKKGTWRVHLDERFEMIVRAPLVSPEGPQSIGVPQPRAESAPPRAVSDRQCSHPDSG